ncbi:sensor histidine kinase [Paenibacillus xerothermodurans]|uniref:Sensor histidine kinase n=2 Tax=Paenibacillus xerothermodurans TaxID=1977292 RepID=A0A2W1NAR2_PAEXE|nr:sensor histidine kinase [Paenibacillus xerothermodurans]
MWQSIRFKLTMLFLAAIVFPVVVIVVAIPFYYQKLIANQGSSLMEGTLTALAFSIDAYLDDLERMTITPYLHDDVMRALKLKSTFQWQLLTPYEQYEAEQALTTTLPKFLKNTRKDILGTILLPMDESVYITSSNGYSNRAVAGYPFDKQHWYIQALRADGDVAFISVHVQNYLVKGGAEVFSVARLIKDPDSQRPLGVIMADADTAALERIMRGIRLNDGAIAAILDNERKMIYASRPLPDDVHGELAAGNRAVGDTDDRYFVVSQTLKRAGWEIVVLSPESAIKSQLHRIYWVGALFAASGLMIALLLYATVSRWLLTPFKQMVQVMKRVQRGNLQTFYPVRGSDEIAQLGQSLNQMISQLGDLIDREFRAVLGQRNAEYRALQSQIHPHFLYNTLNGLIGLNRTGQSVLLERAILSLSGMLRYTLAQNDWAELKDEMAFITKYCELQQIRFREKLGFQIDCDPAAEAVLIPKLLLQPLVENAVIHGIEPSGTACVLRITAAVEEVPESGGSRLEIVIADNGVGFDPGKQKEGVGTANVRERLCLAYTGSTMHVESQVGHGTVARLQILLKDVDSR